MDTSHFVYPFPCWWTLRLFPTSRYCEQSCNGTFTHKILLNICFQSGGYIPTRGTAGSYGNSMFNFLRQHQTISHSWLYHCTFPTAGHNGSNFSASSQMPVIFCFFTMVILVDLKWHLTVLLIYTCLMTNDAIFSSDFWSFLYLLLEKCLFKYLAHF